jgi:putative transposase
MDGRGAWLDDVFVERLWRIIKHEEVCLRIQASISEARASPGPRRICLDMVNPCGGLDRQTAHKACFNHLQPNPSSA